MREWVRRADFRDALPVLLDGEDAEFTDYMRCLADTERRSLAPEPAGNRTPASP
jgi:hypothetical protein